MPIIGRFYNIIVKMYYFEDEHNPPHIHAKYNEHEAVFSLLTGDIIRGNLPKKRWALSERIYISISGKANNHVGKSGFWRIKI